MKNRTEIENETIIDYFLRYWADVPIDEISSHQAFSRECPCNPDVNFNPADGWHTLTHKPIADETLDWEQAYKYFDDVRKQYQEFAGTPGVNTTLALEHIFRPIAERFRRGERTPELYEEMISVE